MAVTPITAANVVTRAREIYSDLDTTTALLFVNRIHKRILNRLQLRNKSDDISLTAGTREYDLPTGCVKVWNAYYMRSATDYTQLTERTTDELDLRDRGWRQRTNVGGSDPTQYYITSAVDGDGAKFAIGFLPTPPTTTSTYPKVVITDTNISELDTGDSIPATILDEEVYVSGVAWLWARREHRSEIERWKESFEELLDDCAEHLKNMAAHTNTEIHFPFIASGSSVI